MITLKDFGSFHVGGKQVTISGQPKKHINFTPQASFEHDPNGTFQIEHAYVQYFIPEPLQHELPVLMIHGGGMTGANWETTPDGRPGWIQRFLEAGYATYVIDNVERGRAGWCALPDQWAGEPIMRPDVQAWELFRFGKVEDFPSRKPFAEMQFPIEALTQFSQHSVPRWTTTDAPMKAGILAALERIGPCIVICHSQGGELSLDTVGQRPDLVRHAISLEGSGFPNVDTAVDLSRQHWLFIMGDNIEAHPFWVTRMAETKAAIEALTKGGSDATLCHLPESGILGNSHMLMMDRNSDQIARLVMDWLETRL